MTYTTWNYLPEKKFFEPWLVMLVIITVPSYLGFITTLQSLRIILLLDTFSLGFSSRMWFVGLARFASSML